MLGTDCSHHTLGSTALYFVQHCVLVITDVLILVLLHMLLSKWVGK